MAINHGLGGPKAMVRTAADGQLVNIPARRYIADGGTEETNRSALMVWHRWLPELLRRQIRATRFNADFVAGVRFGFVRAKFYEETL